MEINMLHKAGIGLIFLNLIFILMYYYGAAKVYNLQEDKKYRYMGCFWIFKSNGEYVLRIPKEVLEESVTTQYRIYPEEAFRKWNRKRRIRISFADNYDIFTDISTVITVKNHIATSHRL